MAAGPGVNLSIERMEFAGGGLVFDGLQLSVAPGEVLALIGASGVGKTTLLRIIGGMETGFAGRVTVGGVPAVTAPVPGFVFQDARLLPWLTVAQNILAVSPDLPCARIAQLLAQVGLDGLQASYPHQLSGGMQRRLGLARAISVNPGLLLLDEPFVSLDRAVVKELQAWVSRIFAEVRPTAILVSHDPEDAARLADRVVILAGRPARVAADFRLPRVPRQAERSALEVAQVVDLIERAGQAGAAMTGAAPAEMPLEFR